MLHWVKNITLKMFLKIRLRVRLVSQLIKEQRIFNPDNVSLPTGSMYEGGRMNPFSAKKDG